MLFMYLCFDCISTEVEFVVICMARSVLFSGNMQSRTKYLFSNTETHLSEEFLAT